MKLVTDLSRSAVAGAVLSTVATIVELAIVVAATSPSTLKALARPLIASAVTALMYGLLFMLRTIRSEVPQSAQRGRAFNPKTAVAFAMMIAAMLMISAALNAWLGSRGVLAAAATAGFADTHSPAVSVASLVAGGSLSTGDTAFPILAALTSNTGTKMALAITSGGRRFALQVIPGLMLVVVAAWLAILF